MHVHLTDELAVQLLKAVQDQAAPLNNVDLVLIIGPGVIIGLVAVVVAYLKWRKP